jgi:hypothetical protein
VNRGSGGGEKKYQVERKKDREEWRHRVEEVVVATPPRNTFARD